MNPADIRQLGKHMHIADEPVVAELLALLADLLDAAYEQPVNYSKGMNVLMRIQDMKP